MVQQVWKRIHCPGCKKLIRVRYATDGSFILQDSKPSLLPPSETADEVEYMSEVKKLVAEKIREHEESNYHE